MATSYPSIKIVQPENLQLESLKGYNPKWKEKYEWFIHSILYKQLTTKNHFNNYVNLSGKLLQYYVGPKYFKKIKTSLINNKVIEYNKKFSFGNAATSFSNSYRLTSKYNDAEIKTIEYGETYQEQTYCRKIFVYNKEYLNNLLKDDLIRKEFLSLSYWRINVNAALNYIASRNDFTTKQRESRKLQVYEVNNIKNIIKEGGIIQASFTFKKDRAGRIHTPLTNLAADLRKFLFQVNTPDKEIVCHDFSNSQILFFVSKYLNKKVNTIGGESMIPNTYESKQTGEPSQPSAALSGQTHPLPYNINNYPDIIHFKNLVFAGKIYDGIMQAIQWKGTRKEFKEKFFGELWYNSNVRGKKERVKLTEMEKVFKAAFPNVFKILWRIKATIGNREFCINLQREEARLLHRWIVGSIDKKVKYFVVHDAIYTTSDYSKYIGELLQDASIQYFGEYVSIKSELCN